MPVTLPGAKPKVGSRPRDKRCHHHHQVKESLTPNPSARHDRTCSDNPCIQTNGWPTSLSLPQHASSCLAPKINGALRPEFKGNMGFQGWRTSPGISTHPLHERHAAATETKPNSPFKHAFLNDAHPQNSPASLRLPSGPSFNATRGQNQGQQEMSYLKAPQGLDN